MLLQGGISKSSVKHIFLVLADKCGAFYIDFQIAEKLTFKMYAQFELPSISPTSVFAKLSLSSSTYENHVNSFSGNFLILLLYESFSYINASSVFPFLFRLFMYVLLSLLYLC